MQYTWPCLTCLKIGHKYTFFHQIYPTIPWAMLGTSHSRILTSFSVMVNTSCSLKPTAKEKPFLACLKLGRKYKCNHHISHIHGPCLVPQNSDCEPHFLSWETNSSHKPWDCTQNSLMLKSSLSLILAPFWIFAKNPHRTCLVFLLFQYT